MAIYKNREVNILGPNNQANSPETINISYQDGSHENVKLSDIEFTSDEKNSLIKNYPSKYSNVNLVTPKPKEPTTTVTPVAAVETDK